MGMSLTENIKTYNENKETIVLIKILSVVCLGSIEQEMMPVSWFSNSD